MRRGLEVGPEGAPLLHVVFFFGRLLPAGSTGPFRTGRPGSASLPFRTCTVPDVSLSGRSLFRTRGVFQRPIPLAPHGHTLSTMTAPRAADLMTGDVLAAQADWTLDALADFFIEHAISGAPVVTSHGGVVGVVSVRDLARHQQGLGEGESEESGSADAATMRAESSSPPAFFVGHVAASPEDSPQTVKAGNAQETVRDIMTPTIFTVEESASVYDAADRMVRGHLHRLLVVRDGTRRDVVGILSALDVLEWLRGATGDQAAGTPGG